MARGEPVGGRVTPTAMRAPLDSYDGRVQPTSQPADELVERRIVTVLFADLVGFTTLSERYDPEDVAAIQDAYFAMVRETIGRYGGRLEKFIGDAAMAVFGVPRSRDDDVARAIRAGLALVHGVQQIGASLGLDDDILRLRVGINTGEAVVSSGAGDEARVTGDTVNTAARLQTAAPPGGVLVGEITALAAADVADMHPIPALELKGKAEPTAAWLVTGVRAEPSREQAMGALGAPMLGRVAELAELIDAHGRVTAGAVERWLIVAAPGVGKSRLLREFADRVALDEAGTTVIHSRARADSVSPFGAVARLLLDALGTAEARDAEQRIVAAVVQAGATEQRARVVAEACLSVMDPSATGAAGEPAKPSDDREALFGAWLDALDALAGNRASVWLIEDVQWAGGDVLAFLDFATRGNRRLIVATGRLSLLESHGDWAIEDAPAGRRVMRLSALERSDAGGLVTALVGDALPADLVERIADRSDGNCLFIEELLRTWVSVGTLVSGTDGKWRLTLAPGDIPLPQSIQSIYAAQLDDLPADARRLARRASVAGRRFPVRALEPLGARSADGLEPLRRRELVTGPVSEPLWGEAYAYRHALLREAGYASLARAERARLHVRLARWLEAAAGERSAEVAEQIAGHYSAALDSAPALAREIDDGLDREAVRRLAADWYERAGHGTLALSAHHAARQLLRRSIDLTPDETPLDKARRWERLGDATAFAADMDEGAAAYRKAMELYRTAILKGGEGFDRGSDALTRASGQMARGAERMARLSSEGARALAEGAAQLQAGSAALQKSKADFEQGLGAARAGLARAAASLAEVMNQQLQFADSRSLASQVADELPDADPGSKARLLIAQAMGAVGASGPSEATEAEIEQAIRLAQAAGDRRTELHAIHALSVLKTESGRDDPATWRAVEAAALDARDWSMAATAATNAAMAQLDDHASEVPAQLARARETAAAHGLTEDAGWIDYVLTEAAFVSGDWDRALEIGTAVLDVAVANAYLRLHVRTLHVLVPIAAVRGRTDILERAADWYAGLEGKLELPDSPYARIVRVAQDIELAAHGLRPSYVPEVEPRIASFDDPSGPSWSAALDRVVRAWLEAGQSDGARRALEHMAGQLPRFPNVSRLGIGTYHLMRGRVAFATGDPPGAIGAAYRALEQLRASSAPWWVAKAIRLLERSGGADASLLSEVEQIERRLGAVAPTA